MGAQTLVNVALLLWGGAFCLIAVICLLMSDEYEPERRNRLIALELCTSIVLFSDAVAWFVQGTPGAVSRFFMYACNLVVYGGLYLVLLLFHRYVCCYIQQKGAPKPKRGRMVEGIGGGGLLLVVVSQFSQLYYYIDEQNVYHRSSTFPISMLILLVGMLVELSLLVEHRARFPRGRLFALCTCILLPITVAGIQMVHSNISMIDLALGVSMMLLFIMATTSRNKELAEAEKVKEQIRERLEIETTLNRCVAKLSTNNNVDVGMNNLLESINDYFESDRTYVFEIDFERNVLINTYEYVRGQVTAQKDNLQEVPVEVIDVWMQSFRKKEAYYIPNLEQERGLPSYEMLQEQQVWRLLAVPLLKDNQTVIGFLGVDNPREHYEDATLLASIQYFITNSIERRKQKEYLERLSYYDMLTGLYNRNKYIEVIELTRKVRPEQVGAMYIDLNGLKRVNDQQGHRAGDDLIIRAARAIGAVFPEDAYRVGGDEFVVIQLDVSEQEFAEKTVLLRRKMEEAQVNVSIGTVWRQEAEDLEELLRKADECMYKEKKQYHQAEAEAYA